MAVFFINVASQSLQATFYLYPGTIAKYRRQFYQIRPFARTLKSNPEHPLDATQNYYTTANNYAMYYAENATAFHTANIQRAPSLQAPFHTMYKQLLSLHNVAQHHSIFAKRSN